MLVLALDTSTPTVTAGVVSVTPVHEALAAADGGPGQVQLESPVRLLAETSVTDPFAHAERLMPLAQQALRSCGHTLAQIAAVVVGLGPGPFTGLRVGIATGAALGDALEVPVHGIASHDAIAMTGSERGALDVDFLVVSDARRREIYLSAYRAGGRRAYGPAVLSPAAVPDLLIAQRLVPATMIGPGAELLADRLDLPVTKMSGSLAAGLVVRALQPLLTGAMPGPLQPLYLRRPDATEPSARKSVLG